MSEELFNSASCSGDCADCGSDCQDLDQPTVTLTLDDDTEVKCAVLTIFPAPNQKEYIALLPLDENGENEDGEVYLYRYYEENGQPNLDGYRAVQRDGRKFHRRVRITDFETIAEPGGRPYFPAGFFSLFLSNSHYFLFVQLFCISL